MIPNIIPKIIFPAFPFFMQSLLTAKKGCRMKPVSESLVRQLLIFSLRLIQLLLHLQKALLPLPPERFHPESPDPELHLPGYPHPAPVLLPLLPESDLYPDGHWNIFFIPVPAGISLPIRTFSFRPISGSILPLIAASVRTFVVSWKEAADRKELVAREALVIPSITCLPSAGSLPSAISS